MSRATLSVQNLVPGATNVTLTAPNGVGTGNGNTFTDVSGDVLLICYNTSTVKTITVPDNGNLVQGIGVADLTATITTSPAITIVAIPPTWYSSAGTVSVDVDSTSGLTWAAVRQPTAF